MDKDGKVLFKREKSTPNFKGDQIFNQYKYYGPGVYTKERVKYDNKNFMKKISDSKATVQRYLDTLRAKFNRDFALNSGEVNFNI